MQVFMCFYILLFTIPVSSQESSRCLKRVGQISVLQHPPQAVKEVGASVEMNCTLELPQGHPRPSRVLVAWHRGHRGDSLTGMGKISEAEELQGRVKTAWLENVSASILHIHTLQQNDSALYLCLFVIFPSAQPCLLEGNGTHLTVTSFSAWRNTTQINPEHGELHAHHWTLRLLALGTAILLMPALCFACKGRGEVRCRN